MCRDVLHHNLSGGNVLLEVCTYLKGTRKRKHSRYLIHFYYGHSFIPSLLKFTYFLHYSKWKRKLYVSSCLFSPFPLDPFCFRSTAKVNRGNNEHYDHDDITLKVAACLDFFFRRICQFRFIFKLYRWWSSYWIHVLVQSTLLPPVKPNFWYFFL